MEARESGGKKLRRSMKTEYFPWIVVDPVCGLPELFWETRLKSVPFARRVIPFCFSLEPRSLELYGWQ